MRVNAHGTNRILSRRTLLLGTTLLAACKREITHQRVDPALAPLLPPDTTTLLGVRVDHLRKTPAWDILFPPTGAIALETLKQQTGIDLRTALYEVVYALGGRHRLALIRGKFVDGGITNAGLEPELKLEGAQKFPYKGFTLIGKEEQAVTFLNSSVAIAGRASALRAVIDNRELKNSIPTHLLGMVDALPPESHLYLVSNSPSIPEGGIGGLRSLPLSLQSFTAYLDFRTAADLHATAVGATPEDAKKLHDGLKAMLSLLRLTLKGEQKDILASLDNMQLTLNEATLNINASLPLDTLSKAIQSLDILSAKRQ